MWEVVNQQAEFMREALRVARYGVASYHTEPVASDRISTLAFPLFITYRQPYATSSIAGLGSRCTPVTAKVRRLDDFVSEQKLSVSLIKCDCEGAEFMVFQGAAETLGSLRPIICTEMLRKWSAKFGYHPNDLIAYIAGFGYRCYSVCENRLSVVERMNEDTAETNFIFLHLEAHAAQIARLACQRDEVTTA